MTDLDAYEEKLCNLVDHHFERKKFSRHVSTGIPTGSETRKKENLKRSVEALLVLKTKFNGALNVQNLLLLVYCGALVKGRPRASHAEHPLPGLI
jgi:hypothetical protein